MELWLYGAFMELSDNSYVIFCMSRHKNTPAEQTVCIKNFVSGLRKYPQNICLSPDPVLWSCVTFVTSLDFSSLIGRARAITCVSETVREMNTGHIPHASWFTESVQESVTTVILKGAIRGWTIWKLWILEIKKIEYHSISLGSSNYCMNRTITWSVVGNQRKTCHPSCWGQAETQREWLAQGHVTVGSWDWNPPAGLPASRPSLSHLPSTRLLAIVKYSCPWLGLDSRGTEWTQAWAFPWGCPPSLCQEELPSVPDTLYLPLLGTSWPHFSGFPGQVTEASLVGSLCRGCWVVQLSHNSSSLFPLALPPASLTFHVFTADDAPEHRLGCPPLSCPLSVVSCPWTALLERPITAQTPSGQCEPCSPLQTCGLSYS